MDISLTWRQFYRGLYAVECKDRWVLAAAWKVVPRFKCTKNSHSHGIVVFLLSLMNAVDLSALLVLSRSTNDSPCCRRAAALEPLDRMKRKSTGLGLLVLIRFSGDPLWVGLVEEFP